MQKLLKFLLQQKGWPELTASLAGTSAWVARLPPLPLSLYPGAGSWPELPLAGSSAQLPPKFRKSPRSIRERRKSFLSPPLLHTFETSRFFRPFRQWMPMGEKSRGFKGIGFYAFGFCA